MTKGDLIPLYIIVVAIALLILLPIYAYIDMKSQPDGPCIQDSPWVVIAGYIQLPWIGTFTSAPQVYYLYYKGKFKLTGEECRVLRCVTEKEYERHMYKGEN